MDEGSDILEAGVSTGALPSSYVDNVKEATVNAHMENYTIDPLSNLPADVSAAGDDNDKSGTTLEWLAVIKREEEPLRDIDDEADGDEEGTGTSSFENLSPLSDDTQVFTKGFRKVLGINYIYMWYI